MDSIVEKVLLSLSLHHWIYKNRYFCLQHDVSISVQSLFLIILMSHYIVLISDNSVCICSLSLAIITFRWNYTLSRKPLHETQSQ